MALGPNETNLTVKGKEADAIDLGVSQNFQLSEATRGDVYFTSDGEEDGVGWAQLSDFVPVYFFNCLSICFLFMDSCVDASGS